jgi:putative alpha-1,2-mannosidase
VLIRSSYVPHAIPELVELFGGPDSFLSRLNFLHTSGLTDIGNEPSFLTVFLFHYAGRPALSSELVHKYIPAYFNDTTIGLPGNDDTGAMASFSAFCMMGLFPNPGQNIYFISAPFFASISITSPITGKTATIKTSNFDSGYRNIYVQNATLDGVPYTKNWIDHSFFTEGKTLVLTVAGQEGNWGTRAEDAPPGISGGGNGSARLL